MLSVLELRQLAASLPPLEFKRQLGPFALIQRPPAELAQLMAIQLGAQQTMYAPRDLGQRDRMALLFELENLVVATLPPMAGAEELVVGRLPDCDLVIDDPSVSKRHAILRWDGARRVTVMTDLGSTNGTFLNDQPVQEQEVSLKDWDVAGFGDVSFVYVLTDILFARLSRTAPEP